MERGKAGQKILGIEGGGTKTTWAILAEGRVVLRGEAGPGNTLLLPDVALKDLLQGIQEKAGGEIDAIGAAFAGCQQPAEQKRVEKIIRGVWPAVNAIRVMEDTRSVLSAAFGDGPGVVVIAGTGANVAGQKSLDTAIEKAGGWGHLFADRGSAYDLARRGLEIAFQVFDETRKITPLAREFLCSTGCGTMEELVPALLRDTSKTAVAQGARHVFAAAEKGDRDARALLDEAAEGLARNVVVLARRLKLKSPEIALTGGLFENQADYRKRFQRALKKVLPTAKAYLLAVPGVVGAARMAGAMTIQSGRLAPLPATAPVDAQRLAAFAQASTEQRNPRSRGLDRRTIPQLVDLFIREERLVEGALKAQRKNIAAAAALIAGRLKTGGRLFYVGAGTSGRLGVVDASEMPPTFNAPPEQIQALIAGGPAAIFRSQEGAEDAKEAGVVELQARGLTKKDVVCGIAASGQTPYVLGALDYARGLGAGTVLLSCNPRRVIRVSVEVEIDLPTGPELVTGSTRLKAGTATKLVLNMLSTIAMIQLGRVRDNLMINVQATNDKLRARAVRLVEALSGASADSARAALEKTNWSVASAIERLSRGG